MSNLAHVFLCEGALTERENDMAAFLRKLAPMVFIAVLLACLLSVGVSQLPVAHADGVPEGPPQQVQVNYHYEYSAFSPWCFQFPGVGKTEDGNYDITDGGNITGNGTDDAYFWGYNLVYPSGVVAYAWDQNGNPLPYHINGQYHNLTCGVNA